MRLRFSKLWVRVSALALLVVALLSVLSWKYLWLYLTQKVDPPPVIADLLNDPRTSNNPDVLLDEANRLAWLFNWPKAGSLYARSEELFKAKGDTRNEIYARDGKIRVAEIHLWRIAKLDRAEKRDADSPPPQLAPETQDPSF